jgi:SOS-response transcriptional repressor LexA
MNEVKERIREVRKYLNLSQEELANATDSKRTTVAGYESGVSLPHAEFLMVLNKKFDVNSNWVLTGKGEMFIPQKEKSPVVAELERLIEETVKPDISSLETRLKAVEDALLQQPVEYPAADSAGLELFEPEPEYGVLRELSFVDDIAAGPPIEQHDAPWEIVRVPESLIKSGVISPCYCARVRGDSMTEANIPDGAVVIIAQTDEPVDGAIQVVRYKEKSTLKRVCRGKNGGWELRFEDGSGALIPVDSGDFEVQGTFLAVVPRDLVMIRRD